MASGIPASWHRFRSLIQRMGRYNSGSCEGVTFRAGVSEEHSAPSNFPGGRSCRNAAGPPLPTFCLACENSFRRSPGPLADHPGAPECRHERLIAHQVCIPDRAVEQALHPIRAAFSGVFGELPPVFPFDGTHDAFQVCQRSPTRFRTSKMMGNASMQTFEFSSPFPDLNKGRFGSGWDDLLAWLHVWLLSHEAFFPVSFLPSRRSSGKKRQMRLGAEQLLLNQCRRRGPLLRGGAQGQDGERSHFALQQSLPFALRRVYADLEPA